MAKRPKTVLNSYFARYGFDGVYERMSNRTVSQIFGEYRPEDVNPIASGEMNGMRYDLYDAPIPPATWSGGNKGAADTPI